MLLQFRRTTGSRKEGYWLAHLLAIQICSKSAHSSGATGGGEADQGYCLCFGFMLLTGQEPVKLITVVLKKRKRSRPWIIPLEMRLLGAVLPLQGGARFVPSSFT